VTPDDAARCRSRLVGNAAGWEPQQRAAAGVPSPGRLGPTVACAARPSGPEATAMALNLVVEPVRVATGSADEDGRLVLADGRLVAVLVRLADEIHAGRVGSWFMEAGFGPCADAETALPAFTGLGAMLAWIEHRLAASRSPPVDPHQAKRSPAHDEGSSEHDVARESGPAHAWVQLRPIETSRQRIFGGMPMTSIPSPTGGRGVEPEITPFFDDGTNTVSYVVKDPSSTSCAVIDSVLDFDYAVGRIEHRSADAIVAFICERALALEWLIETHVHADHLSAAPYIQSALGGRIGIGERITAVQDTFGKVFNEGTEFRRDGSQFDRLFADGDAYAVGGMTARVMHTPGHTPACMTHVFGSAAFVGDTLFMPDSGTARADFPGGDPHDLYASIRRILALPPETRLFVCHDYGPDGRNIRWETTVADERLQNVHVRDGVTEDEFVAMRTARDATLAKPRLIIPAIQVNMRGGQLPPPDAENRRYLKVPLNGL